MRTDKGRAFVLRRAGKSYQEISAELGVAKSTLSNWFRGVDFSKAIREELTKVANKKAAKHLRELNRTRGIALEVQYEMAEKEALKEMKLYRNVPLFSACIATYRSVGLLAHKNQLRLTNTDPELLRMFVVFLERFCGISQTDLRLAVFIYKDLDEKKCKRYWSRKTGIKTFHKTQILLGQHKTKRLAYGTATVVLTNSIVARKMNTWIDHLPEMVLNTVPQKRKK